MVKSVILEKTIEIAREYARGGGTTPITTVLEDVYETLKRLDQDTKAE